MDDNATVGTVTSATDGPPLVAPPLPQHTSDDLGRFIRGWVRNPLATGALLPSGRFLARLMATGLAPGTRVIEVGGGTGTVTAAILESGVRPEDLVIVERNADFAAILRRRFPGSRVLEVDALELAQHARARNWQFDCVVSGLPLLLFSAHDKQRFLEQACAVLTQDGCLHQFTYAGLCPVPRDLRARFGLTASLIGVAARNLPPGFVYRLRRRNCA